MPRANSESPKSLSGGQSGSGSGGSASGPPRGAQAAVASAANAALTGRLESIPLFDVCQFLLLNRRTGTLTVRSGDRTLRIYFVGGAIYDITDEAMRTGERLLLEAVQWTGGTFALDPAPPGVAQRITESTEAILLEAARTIDECRSQESAGGLPQKKQEEVFRERQSFAGELAEAFRAAIGPEGERASRAAPSGDPVDAVLRDVAAARGTLVVRGFEGAMRRAGAARSYRSPIDGREILRRLNLDPPRRGVAGDAVEARFEKSGAWFHVSGRNASGETQVRVCYLRTAIASLEEFGCDPAALANLNEHAHGLILWSGMPGGYRSSVLASWIARVATDAGGASGPSLWVEDDPQIAWEVATHLSLYAGDPSRIRLHALLEWNPQRVIIDPARTPQAARLAIEAAEAGIPAIAVVPGLTQAEAFECFERALDRGGTAEVQARIRAVLSAWVGVLPLGDTGLVAMQIERAGAGRPQCSYQEEIERLERDGRIMADVAARLRIDLAASL